MSFAPLSAELRIDRQHVHIQVRNQNTDLILGASLLWPDKPVALLELLEALARWHGQRLDAALHVADLSAISFGQSLHGKGSAEVELTLIVPCERQLRLSLDRRPA